MSIRIVARLCESEPVKYISHLDLIRCVNRAFRRANIPVCYSSGFHPHPILSFASALSVGETSTGEYMDVEIENEIDPFVFCKRMNASLPSGIRLIKAVIVDKKTPSLMSMVSRAKYIIKIHDNDRKICTCMKDFLNKDKIIINKKTKKGVKQVDIRPMIHQVDCAYEEGVAILNSLLSCGSKSNLKATILAAELIKYASYDIEKQLTRIHREDIIIDYKGSYITPLELGRG